MFQVHFYRTPSGDTPAYDWLKSLPPQAESKARARLKMLAEYGDKLRRPYVDYLRNGIYELRWECLHVQYRFLYFFTGTRIIIVSHGLKKRGV
ncbi:MAG: type II toxin-antitoxin system RelE/ParE family toxin, partial [Calditrichota bacterium]